MRREEAKKDYYNSTNCSPISDFFDLQREEKSTLLFLKKIFFEVIILKHKKKDQSILKLFFVPLV